MGRFSGKELAFAATKLGSSSPRVIDKNPVWEVASSISRLALWPTVDHFSGAREFNL